MAAYLSDPIPPPPRLKRWTKREYSDLVAKRAFQGQRIYLFRGNLIERAQNGHSQAYAITQLNAALFEMFGIDQGHEIRIQLPFDTPGESVPEPDALVCTAEQFQRRPHPNVADLVIEIADSRLADDREKALEYAAAGVPEYWIVDVNARRLEVYRNPVPDPTTLLGVRYAAVTIVPEADSISPIARPKASFSVRDVLTLQQ